jgi:thiamine-phosphate pyrophosphorylase|tara:strand:+ start:334 stop:861 length:528 start_codon:yes stop_codon:yes gene_type:complete
MHLNKYYFINKFDPDHIKKLDKNISIIYRNYNSNIDINLLIKIRDFCKKNRRKFYLANNTKLALKLNLDGVYLPSFNKSLKHLNYQIKKEFLIMGSAHNIKEIRVKEKQRTSHIFVSSIFKKEKNYLGFYKFKNLSKITKKKVIALGGIKKSNLKKLNMLNISGFAAIDFFNNKN